MNIRTALLFVALVLCIACIRPIYADHTSQPLLIPTDKNVSSSTNYTLDARFSNPDELQRIREFIILNLSGYNAQQMYWISSPRYQRQVYGFNKTGYSLKIASNCGFNPSHQSEQLKLAISGLLPRVVNSLSHHNLILRL